MFYHFMCIIYVYWCSTRFSYQMMFVLFRSSTTGAASGAGTVYRSLASAFTYVFYFVVFFIERGVRVAQSLLLRTTL